MINLNNLTKDDWEKIKKHLKKSEESKNTKAVRAIASLFAGFEYKKSLTSKNIISSKYFEKINKIYDLYNNSYIKLGQSIPVKRKNAQNKRKNVYQRDNVEYRKLFFEHLNWILKVNNVQSFELSKRNMFKLEVFFYDEGIGKKVIPDLNKLYCYEDIKDEIDDFLSIYLIDNFIDSILDIYSNTSSEFQYNKNKLFDFSKSRDVKNTYNKIIKMTGNPSDNFFEYLKQFFDIDFILELIFQLNKKDLKLLDKTLYLKMLELKNSNDKNFPLIKELYNKFTDFYDKKFKGITIKPELFASNKKKKQKMVQKQIKLVTEEITPFKNVHYIEE